MKIVIAIACFTSLALLGLVVVLNLVATPQPKSKTSDVFGFEALQAAGSEIEIPPLARYTARDGEELAYRIYESASPRILIFVHGSSYHGAGYHALAAFLSRNGAAKVVLPNLRGHYQSGRSRGDVDYIGQFEDDLADLIRFLRLQGLSGPVTLGGHSSGGGLVIRFAGGPDSGLVSGFLPVSPMIPTSPAVRGGDAGGWAVLNMRRLYGLLMFNAVGVHAFDGLSIIAFNKPARLWDGTETLSYSYRLNSSYHPRYDYAKDLRGLADKALVMVGSDDEAIDAEALRALVVAQAPQSKVVILPKVNHLGIAADMTALQTIADWMKKPPLQ